MQYLGVWFSPEVIKYKKKSELISVYMLCAISGPLASSKDQEIIIEISY